MKRSSLALSLDNLPTLISTIRNCHGNPKLATQIHAFMLTTGLHSNTFISNSLISMYSRTRHFDQSLSIFKTMTNADTSSWNTILSGFPHSSDALAFSVQMRRCCVPFDGVTLTTVLTLSSSLHYSEFGLQLHCLVLKGGFESDTFVGNAIITMYMRKGSFIDAEKLFDEMPFRNLVSWNAMISGYGQESDRGLDAILVFQRMTRELDFLDHVSFASAIMTCAHENWLELGRQIHGYALKVGVRAHPAVSNELMSMYSKFGLIDCVRRVFDLISRRDVISWTTMISIDSEHAIPHFREMLLGGVRPNEVTFAVLIFTVSTEESIGNGRVLHGICYKTGFVKEPCASNNLITMYARFESMEESRRVFDEMGHMEVTSWNRIISGYTRNYMCEEAMKMFSSMVLDSNPDRFTLGSVISAISHAETVPLSPGQQCHCYATKIGLSTNEHVAGALIDMYARHGTIDDSERLFISIPDKGLITWTSMISAYTMHGNDRLVMTLFDQMARIGISPEPFAFLAMITACGRTGLVDRGLQIFDSMTRVHGVEPWREHYASVVDMLGRSGRLEEAETFIKKMPSEPGLSTLQSLLGACRIHGNVDMGRRFGDLLIELEPMEAGTYVLMSNMYAERGEWENVARIRKGMREKGVKKEVGFSWVDVGGSGQQQSSSLHMYGFSSIDTSHPQAQEIYRMIDFLAVDMKGDISS